MKKRVVFKKYHYRECDSFADYLERMAAKGWIFKGWKLGLVFYKDQPRKESYAAEIFRKGTKMIKGRNQILRNMPGTVKKPAGSW